MMVVFTVINFKHLFITSYLYDYCLNIINVFFVFIFRLYEVIETISGIHLILEYAHGGELFARLTSEKGPYKEPEAKIIFAQIGSAVQYMVNPIKIY